MYPPTVAEGYERFDSFLGDDEAQEIASTFDWEDTEPLPVTEADGRPSAYYVVIRIDSIERADLLDAALIPWSMQPLFASERTELPDAPVTISAGGAHGGWVFALLPGTLYNYARDAALGGDALFEVVALRELPADAPRNESGSVDLGALAEAGFRWPQPAGRTVEGDGAAARVEPLSEVLSDLVQIAVDIGQAFANAWQDFWGFFDSATSATATLNIALTIASPDADFFPGSGGMLRPILRAWGPGRGTPIVNFGQEIWAEQVGFPFSAYRTTLGPGNTATFAGVANGRNYRVCVRNAVAGARSVDYFLNTMTCSGIVNIAAGTTVANVALGFANQDLQMVTLAADGVAFLAAVQVPIRPPVMAVGNHAQLLTLVNGGNGFVLGMGGRDPVSRIAITILDVTVLGLTGGLAGLVAPFRAAMNVDIAWPPGNPSHLVFLHEFGHHVFYQMMVNATPPANPALFGQHLNTIFVGTVTLGGTTPPPSVFFEPLAINEGMADIMAAQLGGGGNRLGGVPGTYFGDGVGTPPAAGVQETYCDPMTPNGCFEVNLTGTEPLLFPGGNGPLNNAASRLSTIVHDMLDDFPGGPAHNGYVWATVPCGAGGLALCPSPTTLVPLPGPSAGFGEEVIALPINVVQFGIQAWMFDPFNGLRFQTDAVMLGMTRAMRFAGVGDPAICAMYTLHTPGGAGCPLNWMLP